MAAGEATPATAMGITVDSGRKVLLSSRGREHADRVEQRRTDTGGDYEYDEAHEQSGRAPYRPAESRPAPAPAGRPPREPDGDMSYDEAHDF